MLYNFEVEKRTCQARRKSKQSYRKAFLQKVSYLLLNPYSKDAPTNPRGIPCAPFVDKVEDYVSSRAQVDGTMKSFQEMISYAIANCVIFGKY